MSYQLYGSAASYFSAKARAYLRWRGAAYEEIAPDAEIMRDRLLPVIGWPVIPVLGLPDGTLVQDTEDIIEAVEARSPEGLRALPEPGAARVVSLLLQLFADEWLTLPAMHYRWNYNEDWIYGEFGRSSLPDGTREEQVALGRKIGQRFRAFVPALGIDANTIPGIEASYKAFLDDFSRHLEQHPFVLGARASYGDFALVGPLYAHLYRDPASGAIMQRRAPKVADWVERVHGGNGQQGTLAAEVPASLQPMLARHFTEHWPVLAETALRLERWANSAEAGAEVPRGFEMLSFTVAGHSGQGMARSFSLYRLQAVLDAIAEVPATEREATVQWLTAIGAAPLLEYRLPVRLERRNFRLCLAR